MQPFLAMIVPLGDAPIQPPGGGSPPGFWGPTDPRPGNPIANAPGVGHHPSEGDRPSQGPGFPTPPIVIPPQNPGEPPLVIWGPGDPRPTPPINLPGGGNPPPGGDRVQLVEWHTAWSAETGWVVVGTPSGNHPAPSSSPRAAAAPTPKP